MVITLTSQDVILGILMSESNTGYEIKNKFETVFSYFYNASYGTIYPTLSKMEKMGLVTKSNVVQDGKPNKNVYTITDKGRTLFRNYLNSEIGSSEMKSDFMVRLFFGELADPVLVNRWMEAEIRKTEDEVRRLKADEREWRPSMSPTQEICIDIGIALSESTLAILKAKLAQLKWKDQQGGDHDHGKN